MKGPGPRLMLALAALVLTGFALSYWWLGNVVHEVAGTVAIIVLLRHVLNNGAWWRRLGRGRWDKRRVLSTVLTLLLALDALVLCITSVVVSETLFAALNLPGIFVLREIHWFSAYWMMALAGLHLGLNGHRIKTHLARLGALRPTPRPLRWAAILLWFAVALQGVASGGVLGLWPRLSFRYSLAMWDFNASVLPYFLHLGAFVALFAMLGWLAGKATVGDGHRSDAPADGRAPLSDPLTGSKT
ncbi:DUF4405 domain-containing protein [Puniceibacterium confluentis]|uniref:DUF4405 domain-containing protein n=1 Tax=Puniceibacterium confluentis TaxID=1958944 RepID=UPI003561A561